MAVSESDKSRTVADIMSRPVVVVTPDDKMTEAASTMRERRVGSVVAVEGNRPVGILTERDLVRFAASGADAATASVAEWMTASPDSVAPDVDAIAAFASLSEHGYRHIPVVDGDDLVGIVSMRDLMRIAQIQPAENLAHEIPRGLEGVVVAETDIGDVRGLEGFYHYRQYNAVELAEHRTIEDVWHLLLEGDLPTLAQRESFMAMVAPLREIPAPVLDVLPAIAGVGPDAPPLDMLRTTLSLLGAHLGFRPSLDIDAAELRAQALQVCAVVPTLLTAIHRIQHGLDPIAPNPDLAYAANYLYMMRRRGPSGGARACRRAVPDLHDRPRVQRIDVHRAGHHVDRRRPRRRRRRRHRRVVGSAARRRAEPRARHARRDRDPRQRRAVATRRGRAR